MSIDGGSTAHAGVVLKSAVLQVPGKPSSAPTSVYDRYVGRAGDSIERRGADLGPGEVDDRGLSGSGMLFGRVSFFDAFALRRQGLQGRLSGPTATASRVVSRGEAVRSFFWGAGLVNGGR